MHIYTLYTIHVRGRGKKKMYLLKIFKIEIVVQTEEHRKIEKKKNE